jgi:hypothetical protein
MNVLESYLLLQIAMLIGPAAPAPSAVQILLETAQPIEMTVYRVVGMPNDALSALTDFPSKIWVQDSLRDVVARMWTTSPTFRRQCLQVQAAGAVQVQLRLDPAMVDNPRHLALCELRHYSHGAIIARIAVSPVRLAELIGHEMEHVCERLEGIRVETQARNHRPGYYAIGVSELRYETERAIRVGRQVQAEMNVAGALTRTASSSVRLP